MEKAIPAPRPQVSEYAPKIIQTMIDPEKIGDVVGQRGKTINEIIARTGVKIDIEDDGSVSVCGTDQAMMDKAMEEDKIILAALSFDGMSAFMCPLGYAADCDELLGKMGRLSSEANSFFKISFNKKRAQWYFDCPSSYRVIPYDDRRRETYFSDGLVVIRDLLGALGYSPEITVPEECKKGFELPEIK